MGCGRGHVYTYQQKKVRYCQNETSCSTFAETKQADPRLPTVSVSVSAQNDILALIKAHVRSALSLSTPLAVVETELMLLWLNTDVPGIAELKLNYFFPLGIRAVML